MALNINGTTGISGVDGSVSAPAVTGTDSNTGITFPSADTIKFSTGGVERMQITNSGVSGTGIGAGKMLQVVQASATTRLALTSSTFVATVNLVTITPTVASSKIYIQFTGIVNTQDNNRGIQVTVYRSINSGTYENIAPVGSGQTVGANNNSGFTGTIRGSSSRIQVPFAINFLDTPSYSVGNSIVYKLYARSTTGADVEIPASSNAEPIISTAMEIAA
tara:strand:+ start:406 stop:1065 length:660 start_codon:yes stop_codon:yes gene_type:complete